MNEGRTVYLSSWRWAELKRMAENNNQSVERYAEDVLNAHIADVRRAMGGSLEHWQRKSHEEYE